MSEDATQGKVNRMFKYFRGKRISIRYEHNDSLGRHWVRESTVVYDRFKLDAHLGKWDSNFVVTLYAGNKELWIQELSSNWYFTGLGKLEMINSGPRCYFQITISPSALNRAWSQVRSAIG